MQAGPARHSRRNTPKRIALQSHRPKSTSGIPALERLRERDPRLLLVSCLEHLRSTLVVLELRPISCTMSNPRARRIAYLSSEYPCVSQTFIRREITGLEQMDFSILRIGIRAGDVLVDQDDIAEAEKTRYLVNDDVLRLTRLLLRGLLLAGRRIFRAAGATLTLSRASDRGILRHAAYLIESLILRAVLEEEKVQHLHVHFGNNAAALALICRLAGGPTYSVTIHGPDEFDAPIGFSLGLKAAHASFLIAITNYCAAQIKRWVPYRDWGKVHVVHCTVDESWFAPRSRTQPSKDIVCVGRLVANKAQILLVDAFSDAVRQGIEGNLILVGDGEMREEIESRARDLGVSDRIEITGWLSSSEIRQIFQRSRGLALASFAEGLPVVIMEAMATGIPVVSTRITGIPELVIEGETGWLVTAGDQEELTAALVRLTTASDEVVREMGEKSRERAFERHSSTQLTLLADHFARHLANLVAP